MYRNPYYTDPFGPYYPNNNDCEHKLPCGICKLTGQQCPKHIPQPIVTWDSNPVISPFINENLNTEDIIGHYSDPDPVNNHLDITLTKKEEGACPHRNKKRK